MAVAALLETLDGLDEALKPHYVEANGKFKLDVTAGGGLSLEDVSGLRSTVEALRGEKSGLTDKLKAFDGLDPKAARDALVQVAKLADGSGDDKLKAAVAAVKTELEKKHSAELEKREGVNGTLRKQVDKLLIEATATEAISKLKGNAKLLLPHVQAQVSVKESDEGEFVAKVIDAATGNVRMSQQEGNTGDMGIAELVEIMSKHDDFAAAFDGSGGSGMGAGGSKGAGKAVGKNVQLSAADARDVATYRAAREKAEKAGGVVEILE